MQPYNFRLLVPYRTHTGPYLRYLINTKSKAGTAYYRDGETVSKNSQRRPKKNRQRVVFIETAGETGAKQAELL